MAGKHGSAEVGVFLVDGYDLLVAKPQGLSFKVQAMTEPVHGLGDTWVKTSPTGICQATFAQTGAFFDDTANTIHDALKASTDVNRVVTWALTGNSVGARGYGLQGAYGSTYAPQPKVGNLTKADVTYTVSGQIDKGVVLLPQGAQTANWTGTAVDYTADTGQRVIPITSNTQANPTVITTPVPHGLTTGQIILIAGNTGSNAAINGERTVTVVSATTFSVPINCTTAGGTGGTFVLSSTVNGAVGIQSVAAYSGFTGVVGKIQHSADNSTWADLITFTNVTSGPIAERLTVTGTINRYTRSIGTVTGSGSITPFAIVARG